MNSVYIKEDPIIRLQDLTPQKDPKGGSPKTPSGGIRSPKAETPTPYPPPYWTKDVEPRRIGFFHIQFRDILSAISLLAVGMLFVFQRQSDVHDLNIKVANSDKVQIQLAATVSAQGKLIDTNTTSILLQAARNLEQDKEISQSREQLILLIPLAAKIETKLNFVADLLDGKSKEKR